DPEALSVALKALDHPAAGVRRAAVQVLPVEIPRVMSDLLKSEASEDDDLRLRLALLLRMADAPASAEIASVLQQMETSEENRNDLWISHALNIVGSLNKGGLVQNHKQIAKGALPATVVEDALVTLKVIVGEMKFDQELIHAKAGTVLK